MHTQNGCEYLHDIKDTEIPTIKPIVWVQVSPKLGRRVNFIVDQNKQYTFEPTYFQYMVWIAEAKQSGLAHEATWQVREKRLVPKRLAKQYKLVETCLKHSL